MKTITEELSIRLNKLRSEFPEETYISIRDSILEVEK
jgi:hypothetical protein|tara:strand:+ start:10079 stop:10189 length:111 start_codon:yes stop_codon:yes gene_type:complete